MTTYERGDVVLVPFPFSNQRSTKKRPAVVISSSAHNSAHPDIVIIAVTSNLGRERGVGECLIDNWREAGLLKPSAVKPAISTVEQALILRKLGKISIKDIASMNALLKQLLDLSS